MDVELIITFCFSLLRLATPIVYAALAASVCYKASVDNMAIESMMLWAALAGVIVSGASKSAVVGFGAAILAGILVGLIISYASFTGKADLYLTNIAMNLAAAGGTVFVLFLASGDKSNSAGSIQSMVLPVVNLPFIKDIPVLGRIVSGHNILTYGAFAAAFLVNFFIYKTRLGLRLRSVGENPQAAESVGISATKIRYIAFMISGALAGVGGAYMVYGLYVCFCPEHGGRAWFYRFVCQQYGGRIASGSVGFFIHFRQCRRICQHSSDDIGPGRFSSYAAICDYNPGPGGYIDRAQAA